MHEGICRDGPLDGLTYAVRTDQGFLAVDKPAGLAWIYRLGDDGSYSVCTDGDISEVDSVTGARLLDPDRALAAALDEDMDVIAVPDPITEEMSTDGEG